MLPYAPVINIYGTVTIVVSKNSVRQLRSRRCRFNEEYRYEI